MVVTVRDGQKVWPTCAECGCRLRRLSGYIWAHFANDIDDDHDARGCKCINVDKLWELSECSSAW